MLTVIGNFGADYNKFCGQVQRTENIFKALSVYTDKHIVKISTQEHSAKNYIKMGLCIAAASDIIILPGPKSLHKILSILKKVKKLDRSHYVVIGGWLPDYIEQNPHDKVLLSSLASVHVQTETMVKKLNEQGIQNVFWLPNFRMYDHEFTIPDKTSDGKEFRFVYYARVTETKGIGLLLNAFETLQQTEPNIRLAVYGPLEYDYEGVIQDRADNNDKTSYNGVITENALETLSQYDVLVFPTHYEGEGFPGTILESILAGVPVVASDWRYNRELVEKYNVGILHDPFSEEDLREKMHWIMNHPAALSALRENCRKASEQLNSEAIIREFIDTLALR